MSTTVKKTRARPAKKRRAPASARSRPAADKAAFIAAAVADGLAIQHRFKAEPIYSRTGKGYMAPSGVDEIAAAKNARK